MAVDHYAPCPCGSGKKLKFCCSDLVHEIEKVHRMLEGDQPRAALSHLEHTLAKSPGRASLLDLKASIELSLNEIEAACRTVDEYRRVDPENPSAHAQAALIAAGMEPSDDDDPLAAGAPARVAVSHLQDALELVTDAIPQRVLQAVGATGQALLSAGSLMAARAHLWLYQGIAGDEDTRAMDLLMRLNTIGGLPLLLRDAQFLREIPLGHPAEAEHDQAQLLASRGQWRRAVEVLDQLCEKYAEVALLHHNAALVHGWLGNQRQLVAGLHRYAELAATDGLSDDAIEAEAIAQLLDEEIRNAAVEMVETTFAVVDEESLLDRLNRDKHVTPHRLDESDLKAIEGPPPKQAWLMLDKPLPETGVDLTSEKVPQVVGVLSYFGRTTSRHERLELVADQDEQLAATVSLITQAAGDALQGTPEETALGKSHVSVTGFRSGWRFPSDTPVPLRRQIMADDYRHFVLETWPTLPLSQLDGKSPKDASGDPSLQLPLTAAVLVLEQNSAAQADPQVFTELREQLGLAKPESIDASQIEVETIPMARVHRVDLQSLADDDLFMLYKRAELSGANEASLAIAREGVHRPGFADDFPIADLYSRLAELEPDIKDALGWVEQARQDPNACGDSCATWDLSELELRVMEGQFDEANHLVMHLRDEHLEEPGIAERLYRLLSALGAIPADDQSNAMPPEAMSHAEPTPAASSAVWTPGSDAPATGGGQKIWTPD